MELFLIEAESQVMKEMNGYSKEQFLTIVGGYLLNGTDLLM